MRDTRDDVFCFGLCVSRPEHVIDAPTELRVTDLVSGLFSKEAFTCAATFAVGAHGQQSALGGFSASVHGNSNAQVGVFRAQDGKFPNGCLPLYLNEDHWARVHAQLKPILGYFFTLDPLGYKGDQLVALYSILGELVAGRAEDVVHLKSEHAKWIINELTLVCAGVYGDLMKYLSRGNYCQTPRGDLFDDFIGTPFFRSKAMLPALSAVIGAKCVREHLWGALEEPAEACFRAVFAEELWRRSFGDIFKMQAPQVVNAAIDTLIFSSAEEDDGAAAMSLPVITSNSKTKDKAYATVAEYRLGLLSKNATKALIAQYGSNPVPEPEDSGVAAEYQSRPLRDFEATQDAVEALVASQLDLVAPATQKFRSFLPTDLPLKRRFLMVLQALQYHSNDRMNQAVASGAYVDTRTADFAAVTAAWAADVDRRRREKHTANMAAVADISTARRIVATADLLAFAGRLMCMAPTRGGNVFDSLVAEIASGCMSGQRGRGIPLLAEKVRVLMTGKMSLAGTSYDVLARGESWIHCPLGTAAKFREVVDEEAFGAIEAAMHGTWGWVYRESDIPNRHGHCNSAPNPLLASNFKGFRF
eukprot:NODE_374_length_2155_cov_15.631529_g299_i0.p1 GENE.NODE_374_length_2155_cov_15.631529_g299_i0~~NODE_374_length_2155_cov_15.631529_g299_i0.p1  ORF type:complete len:667 (+),score=241.82 NODE_374_length_2155_cov_15.631529_g299_i0:238-2001(+)